MKKTKWTEQEIEKLFHEMPKITDDRQPQEIYQSISSHIKKRHKHSWLMPALASAFAVLLLLILVPNFWQEEKELSLYSSEEIAEDDGAAEAEIVRMPRENEEQSSVPENEIITNQELEKNTGLSTSDQSREGLTAVYEEDLLMFDQLTYAVPDQMAQNVIPLTVLIEKNKELSWFEQFVATGPLLKEEAWGLSEYYPLDATVSYDEKAATILVDLPSNHHYGQGSASLTMFLRSLQETFVSQTEKVEKIEFMTEKERGFDAHGDYVEEISLQAFTQRAYFLYTPLKGEKPYLVPFTKLYDDIATALNEMKKPIETHELTPAIPEQVTIASVEKENNTLHVSLSADSQISNNEQAIYFVEALLLTAKEFGYKKLKLESVPLDKIGPFLLDEPIDIPVGANKQKLTEKNK